MDHSERSCEFKSAFAIHQSRSSRAYVKLVRALEEDTLQNSDVDETELAIVIELLGDPSVYGGEVLYDFLAAFWSLPGTLTRKQNAEVLEVLVKLAQKSDAASNALVLVDAISKLSPEGEAEIYFQRLPNNRDFDTAISIVLDRN